MTPRLTERHKEIITGSSLFVVCVFGFLFGEFGLRVAQGAKFGASQDVETADAFFVDPSTGLRRPRPSRKIGGMLINAAGFRGPEIAIPKPAGTVRIAFLGSSVTLDGYSPEGSTWPELSVSMVRESRPGCRFDFVNAGLTGAGTARMSTYYHTRVRMTSPDLLVVLADDLANDLGRVAAAQGFDTQAGKASWFARRSVLWNKLEMNFRIIRLQRAAFDQAGKVKVDAERQAAWFEQRLESLVLDAKRDGISVALVTITNLLRRGQPKDVQVKTAGHSLYYSPYVSIPDLISLREVYNGVIARTAARNSVAVIDGENEIPADRVHFADSNHFTPEGSAAMASRVGRRLLSSGAVDSAIRHAGCVAAEDRAER